MAYVTLPDEVSANTPDLWEQVAATMAPDAARGLAVSVVGSNVIRMGVGRAVVCGWAFINQSNHDVTVAANATTGTRYDRLVLRKTFTSGGAVSVAPLVLSGASLPALTATFGVGTYDLAVAKWTVAAGSALPTGLVSEAPLGFAPVPEWRGGPLLGVSTFTGLGARPWPAASWTFTPTQTGRATVSVQYDCESVVAGWAANQLIVYVNGVQWDILPVMLESQGRARGRLTLSTQAPLRAGEPCTISVQTNQEQDGSWRFNTFQWIVSQ